MGDPVKIIENALADRWLRDVLHSDSDPEVDAWTALAALHEAGWRIVRAKDDVPSTKGGMWAVIREEWTPDA